MKITVVGKEGCTKCSKMAVILKSKGHNTEIVYPSGATTINGIKINPSEDMHYPLYIAGDRLFTSYKDLNQMISDYLTSPRIEEP